MKLKLTIEYHGAEFVGWQFQPGQRSVEQVVCTAVGEYFQILAKKHSLADAEPVTLSCSGRTDSGVHARGQVASLRWPPQFEFVREHFLRVMQGIAPSDVAVRDARLVDDSFDARKSPHRKCYRYSYCLSDQRSPLFADRSWSIGSNLNIPAMLRAARLFQGRHDFVNFQSAAADTSTTIRTLEIVELSRLADNFLVLDLVGPGFLKNMVRLIAAALVEVGKGELDCAEIAVLLHGDPTHLQTAPEQQRRAPARGLSLQWVHYL